MDPSGVRARLVLLERVGVALIMVAALVPRVRDFSSGWDRELEGFQGSFFVVCAINYERAGLGLLGGYPFVNIDLPPNPRETSYKYPNHPPTVPLLTWASLKLVGPEGWNEAWKDGRPPPDGTEAAARLPFLVLHLLGLLALWWAVRQASGPQPALLALAIAAAVPISVLYGTLINYENPCLPFVLLAYGFHARFLRHGARRDLVACGISLLVGSAVTFTPAFFVPPLVLQLWFHRGWRRAFALGAVTGAAALLPAVLHGAWLKIALPGAAPGNVYSRAANLLSPLTSGEAPFPEWARRQWIRMDHFFSTPLLLAACAGAAVCLWLAWKRWREGPAPSAPADQPPRISLGLPLAAGGLLTLFFFYRHTWDGDRAENGQTVFLLNLVPACAVLAGAFLHLLTKPLRLLRGGFAPLVLLTSLLVLPALARTNTIRYRWRAPGPRDDPSLDVGPARPLPATAGEQLAAALPERAIGFYPRALGYTPATYYYAWRTMLPIHDEDSYAAAAGKAAGALGLVDHPHYLLLPLDPPADAVPEVEAIRTVIDARELPRALATEHWELWRLQ